MELKRNAEKTLKNKEIQDGKKKTSGLSLEVGEKCFPMERKMC